MKIKWGALVVDGRGKIGGHVASKNKAGAYIRTKTTPTNPQTVAQTAARNLFGSISQAWSGLSQTVRDGWNAAVAEWQTTDIFGDLKQPSGKALFQRLNNQAQSAGLSAVTTAPAKAEMPSYIITGAEIDITQGEINLTVSGSTPAEQQVFVGTPTLSDGTTFVKNKLRQFSEGTAGIGFNTANYAAYVAKFGTPTAGDNIYIGVKLVLANGQASPLQVLKASVVAP